MLGSAQGLLNTSQNIPTDSIILDSPSTFHYFLTGQVKRERVINNHRFKNSLPFGIPQVTSRTFPLGPYHPLSSTILNLNPESTIIHNLQQLHVLSHHHSLSTQHVQTPRQAAERPGWSTSIPSLAPPCSRAPHCWGPRTPTRHLSDSARRRLGEGFSWSMEFRRWKMVVSPV